MSDNKLISKFIHAPNQWQCELWDEIQYANIIFISDCANSKSVFKHRVPIMHSHNP
jgi:hypothetical protein